MRAWYAHVAWRFSMLRFVLDGAMSANHGRGLPPVVLKVGGRGKLRDGVCVSA